MKIKTFEFLSALGTIVFGSLLHFTFDWLGQWPPVALISAVNESTWEHLKLAFWPAFVFATLFYLFNKNRPENFCLAQAKKLYLMPILIILIFYGTRALGIHGLVFDISNFIVSVIIGHVVAYWLETKWEGPSFKLVSQIFIVVAILAFSLLTYFPPQNFLFLDPVTGSYGIVR